MIFTNPPKIYLSETYMPPILAIELRNAPKVVVEEPIAGTVGS